MSKKVNHPKKSDTSLPKGYKETKIGIIPMEWEVVKLEEVLKAKPKYGINAPAVKYTDILPRYLRITDIDNDGNFKPEKKVSVDDKNSQKYILQKNDIVFARTGATVGKTYLYNPKDGELVYAGFLIKVTPNHKKLDSTFLKNYTHTHTYWNWIQVMSARSGQPGVNGEEFSLMPIPLPPLKEQQKIAKILTTWDKAIEKQEALIVAKKEFKKGLMQRLLSGDLDEVKLQDIGLRITTKNTSNSIDMVLSNSAVKGIVIQNEFFDKDIANRNNLTGYYIVDSGDFVYNPRISKYAPSGPINRNNHKFSGIVSPLYTIFRINKNEVIEYFEYFFKSTYWFKYMKAVANYGARHDRMNITNNDFMKMPIPYPSKQKQQKIAQILTTADKEIELLKHELEVLREQKRGLMQRLLMGEVRVKV